MSLGHFRQPPRDFQMQGVRAGRSQANIPGLAGSLGGPCKSSPSQRDLLCVELGPAACHLCDPWAVKKKNVYNSFIYNSQKTGNHSKIHQLISEQINGSGKLFSATKGPAPDVCKTQGLSNALRERRKPGSKGHRREGFHLHTFKKILYVFRAVLGSPTQWT